MTDTHTAPAPARPDNLFGVCHAIGEAFGFNPIYLRLLVVLGLLLNFELALLIYAGAGIAVLVASLLTRGGNARSAAMPLAVR